MAIQRERLHRKNATGTYDTIHLETQADIVVRPDGTTVEDALSNPQPISTGGTNASTGAEALYNLISTCETVSDASTISDSDMLGVLDTSSQTAKKISLKKLLNLSGGSEPEEPVTNPNWPNKSDLTLGNTISWLGAEWIVSHVTSTEAYLTMKGTIGECVFGMRNMYCDSYLSTIPEESQTCLKEIGTMLSKRKVFIASTHQMDGGFSYFRSDYARRLGVGYWCSDSSDLYGTYGSYVDENGRIINNNDSYQGTNEVRPSVCVDLTVYDSQGGGGSELNPELPDKDSLTVGNTVAFADQEWIVSHVTSTEAYLTLKNLSGESIWDNLSSACTSFARKFTEAQKECLKTVRADTTSGKVFVATEEQMDGGFSYFNSDSRRKANDWYWTSTDASSDHAYLVYADGSISNGGYYKSNSGGFRPSVCIDLTLYNQ